LTAACKAFSLANGKGTGTNDWVIKSLDLDDWDRQKRKEEGRRSEISERDLQKHFGEFKTINSLQDDKC
jgi:hypothetical protein